MVTLKIKVTKEVIAATSGCRAYSDNIGKNCAVAVAVRQTFPKADVQCNDLWPFGGNKWYSIPLPTKARNFVQKFDRNSKKERLKMKELEFEIKIPDEVIEKINIDEIRPLLENHPTLELVNQ